MTLNELYSYVNSIDLDNQMDISTSFLAEIEEVPFGYTSPCMGFIRIKGSGDHTYPDTYYYHSDILSFEIERHMTINKLKFDGMFLINNSNFTVTIRELTYYRIKHPKSFIEKMGSLAHMGKFHKVLEITDMLAGLNPPYKGFIEYTKLEPNSILIL